MLGRSKERTILFSKGFFKSFFYPRRHDCEREHRRFQNCYCMVSKMKPLGLTVASRAGFKNVEMFFTFFRNFESKLLLQIVIKEFSFFVNGLTMLVRVK